MRKQAGDDKRLFERLVWSEADKATLDKQVKGEVDVPDEVYGVLVEEPVLTHMGHATRRRLFSLEIKVCVPVIGPCIKFDLLKYVEKAFKAIWGFIQEQIDAVLDVFLFVKRIVDACLRCSDRKEQSFVNVYDVFFWSLFFSYIACFLCCVFCCSGQDELGGLCLPIGVSCKLSRMITCKGMSCACFCLACPVIGQRKFNSWVENKCIACCLCPFVYMCAVPAFCFNIVPSF